MPIKKKTKTPTKKTKATAVSKVKLTTSVEDLHNESATNNNEIVQDSSQDKTESGSIFPKEIEKSPKEEKTTPDAKTPEVTAPVVEESTSEDTSPIDPSIRPTGIKALDQILHGGIPANSTIVLSGGSGVGKTTLAFQWLVAGYKDYNETGLFISATEPLHKAINNLKKYSFGKDFKMSKETILFEDLRTIMSNADIEEASFTDDSFDKIIEEISNLIQTCGAKRVVIDSITALAYGMNNKAQIRKFIHKMDALITMNDVNIILTSESATQMYNSFGVEEFIADGIIRLSRERVGAELIRHLEIIKMRGVDYESYPIPYRIKSSGIVMFPQIKQELKYPSYKTRVKSGIRGIDVMTGGGYFRASSILLTGSSGSGKSLFGLQFIHQNLIDGKQALHISFEESYDQIHRNAEAFGWDLKSYEEKKQLIVDCSYPGQRYLDEHLAKIKELIIKNKIEILVIDSISALLNVFDEDTVHEMLSKLNGFIKQESATAIFINASKSLLGQAKISESRVSTLVDQIIMLKYVEVESKLHHALLIVKMRGAKHDKSLKEMVFTPKGLRISGDFSGFEGILSGSTRKISKSVKDSVNELFIEALGPMGQRMFEKQESNGLEYKDISSFFSKLSDDGVINNDEYDTYNDKLKNIYGKSTK